ncbi:hypothetical protein Salat_2565800 [Sesamum alatum]|uniref:Uncharacterized protein n=1 Tax=Sesamum alatum TaxID=300844 RepID=A0AAE1XTM0_9LAMI|nr:hypothetical protein Salat_2565800 [Sesamum alatum]
MSPLRPVPLFSPLWKARPRTTWPTSPLGPRPDRVQVLLSYILPLWLKTLDLTSAFFSQCDPSSLPHSLLVSPPPPLSIVVGNGACVAKGVCPLCFVVVVRWSCGDGISLCGSKALCNWLTADIWVVGASLPSDQGNLSLF